MNEATESKKNEVRCPKPQGHHMRFRIQVPSSSTPREQLFCVLVSALIKGGKVGNYSGKEPLLGISMARRATELTPGSQEKVLCDSRAGWSIEALPHSQGVWVKPHQLCEEYMLREGPLPSLSRASSWVSRQQKLPGAD